VGDSAVKLLITLERAPRGEKPPNNRPTASVLLEAKAAALEWYRSSLSKLSTKREGEAGRRQSDWLANQIGRKMDRQVIDRLKTGRSRQGRQRQHSGLGMYHLEEVVRR
jgi:hypothetical protein